MVTTKSTSQAKAKLTKTDWVMAGLRALVADGPAGLRIDTLARDLGATKGSFYWHFKDLKTFKLTMLGSWEKLATHQITQAVQSSGLAPRDQLFLLFDMVSFIPGDEVGGTAVEPAIRDWGRSDPDARAVLERVDAQRLADLHGFLTDMGQSDAQARSTADILYAGVIGLEQLRLTSGTDMRIRLHELGEALLPSDN